jgi:hypothetical protein
MKGNAVRTSDDKGGYTLIPHPSNLKLACKTALDNSPLKTTHTQQFFAIPNQSLFKSTTKIRDIS